MKEETKNDMKDFFSILIIILIVGFISICCVGFYFDKEFKDIKFNRKLTEALYAELGYKYDMSENATQTLYESQSWLRGMKKIVLGDNEFYFSSSKSVLYRLEELEQKKSK